MATVVDVLKQFADDDLFDAELGEESDSGRNGDLSDGETPKRDWTDKEKDNNSDEEAANSSSDEETGHKRKKRQKKREAKKKSPKPRKAKKAERFSMYSETQRIIRESTFRLPYHKPSVLPISHFLQRVPLSDGKEAGRITKKTPEVWPSDPHSDKMKQDGDEKVDNCDISSPLVGDIASPQGINGEKSFKAVTPKLSAATDPFFLHILDNPSTAKPKSGIQSLKDRFIKHTTKPQDKSDKAVEVVEKDGKTLTEDAPTPKEAVCVPIKLLPDGKLKAATPGSRLQLLKEELQAKMRVRRAENRKVQESQLKLDNEEISEEEEEEEEETTDEEDDSDFEVEKWNEDDKKKQEEGDSDLDEERKEKNVFIDDEADESNDSDNEMDGYNVDSGSEGDISEGDESDGQSDDDNSVFSDKGLPKSSRKVKAKKKFKVSKRSNLDIEEKTMDLFCDSRSQSNDKSSSNDCFPKDSKMESDNNELSASKLCLRLDSVEDGDESNFSFPNLPLSSKLKTKNSSKEDKALISISEVSQDSSQSSVGGALGSEFRESANSLDASSDSSKIPAGQGEGNDQDNQEVDSSNKTPELFSSFSKLRNLIGVSRSQYTQSPIKPGKLSQLTLPVEDSQDLFEDTEDNNFKQNENRTSAVSPNDFHFSLDEDTQFTQILNTQGFINSSRKTKSKGSNGFDDNIKGNTQQDMKELLGLCSGKFSDSEDSPATKNTKPRDTGKECQRGSLFGTQSKESNMKELVGLCSGKFSDDEDEIGEEDLVTGEEEGSDVDRRKSRVDGEDGEDLDNVEEKRDKEVESDPEEMIIKRKYGKKYQAKKRIFDKKNFLEEEAELSGSDVGSDADEDIATDDDELEEDSGDEELPSDEELQKQINKVHMKSMYDQDNADLRAVKEMFLPDGDLYTDGQGRTRHFRWRGIDENSQLSLFGNKEMWGDEEGTNGELITEEEIHRRKERYERETFLREEMGKQKGHILDIDEGSQDILSKIKDTSSQLPDAPSKSKPQLIIDPKSSAAPVLKKMTSFKGSFLKHSKTTLSRLSSLTSNTPNASGAARGFVFQTVSPSGKNIPNAKKMQRTNSLSDEPASKKPKLDRSLSDPNSVFSLL
ncbi:claspin-like [Montipora capricornis]|uniref:claspin-like n=1 Tax=Montipora capricornis TaxID=246305 RepID=UPI0035F1626F